MTLFVMFFSCISGFLFPVIPPGILVCNFNPDFWGGFDFGTVSVGVAIDVWIVGLWK